MNTFLSNRKKSFHRKFASIYLKGKIQRYFTNNCVQQKKKKEKIFPTENKVIFVRQRILYFQCNFKKISTSKVFCFYCLKKHFHFQKTHIEFDCKQKKRCQYLGNLACCLPVVNKIQIAQVEVLLGNTLSAVQSQQQHYVKHLNTVVDIANGHGKERK